MLKLDFINKNYSLKEVIDAFTDGNIDNFKGDEDFLEFLISYSFGNNLVGDKADNFEEWAKYEGLLNIMRLDEYGYFGEKMYKIYEICEKNKMNFIRVCDLIGKYAIEHTLEKTTIDKNLQLKKPVSFYDENIILSNGKKPTYDLNKYPIYHYDLDSKERIEYDYELERSLRHRINESIKENNDEISLLDEMPSYVDKKRLEKQEKENKRVKDEHLVDLDNLFFGVQNLDISGGVLGINMKLVSWFEYTNIDMLNHHVFRSIPDGDYCLVDNNGQIHIPNEIVKNNDISIAPTSPIRSLNIVNVPRIFDEAIKVLENDPIENEMTILRAKGLLELLENKNKLSVGEIQTYADFVRFLFEKAYGEVFKEKGEVNYKDDDKNAKRF